MPEIPRAVLSHHFGDRMNGRRLVSAVFLTFRFDPGFFEQEVLPVFLDVPLSHATAIRLVQLEDALRSLPGPIAVYYDVNGLQQSDAGGAKLDVRRIPVQHRTGIFHPKNVFALVEAKEEDEEGHRPRSLLVASLSANLTRAGWWENVEVCHVEEIPESGKTRLRDDLIKYLAWLERKVPAQEEHAALREIRAFLRGTEQRAQRTDNGVLHTHFYDGKQPIPDFLIEVMGNALRGMYLEVISPYFDDAAESKPLADLLDRFSPRETRVYLPRGRRGEALCRPELYAWVNGLEGVGWAGLPKDLLRLGKGENAGSRTVHAKVYRFFSQHPKREILFMGSANLTIAAHSAGGNAETGFLVEVIPARRPDFWLSADERRPGAFHVEGEDEGTAASGGTRLRLRYRWNTGTAEAYWDDPKPSPALRVEAQGEELFRLADLPGRQWNALPESDAHRLGALLKSASFLTVHGDAATPGILLVQEEGMSHKPSLLTELSAADILRYWSLLTVEQRAAFLEARAPELALLGQGADLVAASRLVVDKDTMFDRFAGIFHAFGCLEGAVHEALTRENEREATYRLFGKKYDSLGNLLARILHGEGHGDAVDRYVIVLCARQLCAEVRKRWPDFWREHAADVVALERLFEDARPIREALIAKAPDEMGPFLAWFDEWFLRRQETLGARS
ncbi:hypothetical protein WMF31_38160 [Sorangium sp. So ce1036]|uniref:hypothetical protein n=1 Tax=Sorangium sp. So ce1036 TaxID=3133328 RepID=UPI003EFF474F